MCIKLSKTGNSLVVQWLGLCIFTAEGPGSIPGLVRELRSHKPCGMAKKNPPKQRKLN